MGELKRRQALEGMEGLVVVEYTQPGCLLASMRRSATLRQLSLRLGAVGEPARRERGPALPPATGKAC